MRFTARADDGGWGVWDSATAGFRTARDLSEVEARRQAAEMDVQYDTYGHRPASDVRRLDQALEVEVAQWQPAGRLEVWIRERGRWYGRVHDPDGRVQWHPASDLRPGPAPGSR